MQLKIIEKPYLFESCAENLPEQITCISKRDFDILGIPFDNPEGGFQRKGCLCVAGKTELLNNKKEMSFWMFILLLERLKYG